MDPCQLEYVRGQHRADPLQFTTPQETDTLARQAALRQGAAGISYGPRLTAALHAGQALLLVRDAFFLAARFGNQAVPAILPHGPVLLEADVSSVTNGIPVIMSRAFGI